MSKVDDELTRRLHRAERPVDDDRLFEGLERRRSHRERVRRVQGALLAFAVLATTVVGFIALRHAFEGNRTPGVATELPANGRIVFSSDVHYGNRFAVHLFSMEPDISAPMQLTEGNSGNWSADVSPDGGSIAFTHDSYESGEVVIATMTINGAKLSKLTDPALMAGNPTWSPDGTRIAFTGGRRQSQRIYVMNADGSDPHPITDDGIFLPEDPSWSPDGSLIAFRGSPTPPTAPEGPTTPDIYTIEPDGQHPTNITSSPAAESEPVWSPDGGRIAYTYDNLPDEHVLDIVVRRLSDGAETFLTDGPELDDDPVWSPDGRFIVFSRQPVVNGRFELWRIRTDGSAPIMLTMDGYGASWQPIPRDASSPTPLTSPGPQPEGRDIGLGFNLCHDERLGGIDFRGDGTSGTAWIGVPTHVDGTCPRYPQPGSYVVAEDHTADGVADSWLDLPWTCDVDCIPYDATDLDGDGSEELIVASYFSIVDYHVLRLRPDAGGALQIRPLLLAEPGHAPAGLVAGEPFRIDAGGDEGYGSQIECEGYPGAPILIWSWSNQPVETNRPREVHITRLQLQADGLFHVIATNDYTVPADQPSGIQAWTQPACGVDWHPAP
jgi:Tol biopolymer transport system component